MVIGGGAGAGLMPGMLGREALGERRVGSAGGAAARSRFNWRRSARSRAGWSSRHDRRVEDARWRRGWVISRRSRTARLVPAGVASCTMRGGARPAPGPVSVAGCAGPPPHARTRQVWPTRSRRSVAISSPTALSAGGDDAGRREVVKREGCGADRWFVRKVSATDG